MKLLGKVFVFLFVPTIASANTLYECNRTAFNSQGLTSRAAAENVYPKKMQIVYSDDDRHAAGYYGVSAKRSKNARKSGTSRFPMRGGLTFYLRHQDFDSPTSVLKVNYEMTGKKLPAQAAYKCGPAKETNWWPKDDD